MSNLVIAIRDAIPKQYRPWAQGLYYAMVSIPYLGITKTCPCCGWRFRTFRRYRPSHLPNTVHMQCPHCRSIARHRWIWLYLKEQLDIANTRIRILHFAQEYCLYRALKRLPGVEAIGSDILRQERVVVQQDITRLAFAAAEFDAIICNHVLEHVPNDHKAMSELYRVLKPNGWVLLSTPVRMDEATYEDASITDARQRERAFGQWDHVRWYGYDLVDRLEAAGFEVTISYVKDVPAEIREKYGLGYDDILFLCQKFGEQGPA